VAFQAEPPILGTDLGTVRIPFILSSLLAPVSLCSLLSCRQLTLLTLDYGIRSGQMIRLTEVAPFVRTIFVLS
jgi:hypothetical protein